ncbi:uncharacterized protein LOC142056062 [Phalacrocorax aristotelis]|uniref:uncharacterized protein LOC142056062 n=1 Tax=Phalacrocorax aristotelis TaxID=126867 RepID=UPI003F4C9121
MTSQRPCSSTVARATPLPPSPRAVPLIPAHATALSRTSGARAPSLATCPHARPHANELALIKRKTSPGGEVAERQGHLGAPPHPAHDSARLAAAGKHGPSPTGTTRPGAQNTREGGRSFPEAWRTSPARHFQQPSLEKVLNGHVRTHLGAGSEGITHHGASQQSGSFVIAPRLRYPSAFCQTAPRNHPAAAPVRSDHACQIRQEAVTALLLYAAISKPHGYFNACFRNCRFKLQTLVIRLEFLFP